MSEPKIIERVVLNCTDLSGATTGCTKKGSNKYWIGEVQQNASGTYDYICKWGEVGKKPSTVGSKYGISEAAALKALNTKVKSKTKVRKNKGVYVRVETRSKQDEVQKAADAGVNIKTGKKVAQPKKVAPSRTFHPEVNRLLNVFYGSTARAVRTGLSSTAGSTEGNPIGNLSDGQLDLGGSLLDEIGSLITKKFGQPDPNDKNMMATTLPLVKGKPSSRISDLTNRYLSSIPRSIDRKKMGPANFHQVVVSSFDRLQAEREFLQLLRDAHLTKATFQQAAKATASDKNVIWYDGLSCDIEFCEPGSQGYKFATEVFSTKQSRHNANWWRNGRTNLRVGKVWKLTRQGSAQRFTDYARKITSKPGALGNIWAWHGTRTENLLGIGKSGLLMPENLPRGVKLSGKAFGAGIYHAPCWPATNTTHVGGSRTDGTNGALKSMNYTGGRGAYYGSGTGNTVYMFLQELALGPAQILTRASWDQHRPTGWPQKDWIYANAGGCSTLTHDEVVTFDQDAQVFRYLMEIEIL